MKFTSYRSTCTAKEPRPLQLKFSSLFNEHYFSLAIFLKYFVRKNWQGGGESFLKNGTIDGYVPGRIYIARDRWHLGDFCNIFLPNINEDQKKVLLSEGRAWH